jgi:hypothetical protein
MTADPKPGDRFEIVLIGSTGRLRLPAVLGPNGFAVEEIEDVEGHLVDSVVVPGEDSLILPNLAEIPDPLTATYWLEYRAPGRFRLIAIPGSSLPANGELMTDQGVPIIFDAHDWSVLQEVAESRSGLDAFDLALQAARLATHAGFDRLICLPLVRDIELL